MELEVLWCKKTWSWSNFIELLFVLSFEAGTARLAQSKALIPLQGFGLASVDNIHKAWLGIVGAILVGTFVSSTKVFGRVESFQLPKGQEV